MCSRLTNNKTVEGANKTYTSTFLRKVVICRRCKPTNTTKLPSQNHPYQKYIVRLQVKTKKSPTNSNSKSTNRAQAAKRAASSLPVVPSASKIGLVKGPVIGPSLGTRLPVTTRSRATPSTPEQNSISSPQLTKDRICLFSRTKTTD